MASLSAPEREGAKVVVSDVSDNGQKTARTINAQGGNAMFVQCDVANPEAVEHLIQTTVDRYGKVDCAFNNAGVGGAQASTADYTFADWNHVLSINLTGVWLCMKYELQAMLRQGSGVIVNNASILGVVGFRGAPAYVAAKHGILGVTKTAALEVALAGVRVAAVCPGFIHTPMVDNAFQGDEQAEQGIAALHAMGRLGNPEEIASAVIWLCSDSASFVTGQSLVIDGGYTAQ